ncbi:MAG: MFS transporter [Ignavibacteriales bacterium]|nr:MFS transporter [Ignavibacteriales bacterium]
MDTVAKSKKYEQVSSAGKRNVKALGLVSMFNDIASEMVYPIIPIFLTTFLGAPIPIVGVIEGIAEATASMLKVFSGWLSDRLRHRKSFVAVGYTLSALAKIVLSVAASWLYVLFARFIDRFGKGIRTSARDALIADSASPETRGAAFGLHRALDTAGAVVGPLLALVLLHFLDNKYSLIFFLASIPAFIGVGILLLVVKEPKHEIKKSEFKLKFPLRSFSKPYKIFLLVNILFALGNSSDAFLILRTQSLGYTTTGAVVLYVVFNAFYSLLSYPFGKLSDRFGARPILIGSFLLFAIVYAGFGIASNGLILWILFPMYGLYMAMSEGISKAYISNLVPSETRATAIGLFYTSTGIVTFFSSLIAGLLWNYVGVSTPFYFGAVCSILAMILFLNDASLNKSKA